MSVIIAVMISFPVVSVGFWCLGYWAARWSAQRSVDLAPDGDRLYDALTLPHKD